MNARGGAVLYTPEILALAVELADHPVDVSYPLRGDAHSRVCGSKVGMTILQDQAGRIAAVGARVSACAIGQASTALFIRSAPGRDYAQVAEALAEIEGWLAGAEPLPSWPGIAALAAARGYPARHSAILLPWKAALAALPNRVVAD